MRHLSKGIWQVVMPLEALKCWIINYATPKNHLLTLLSQGATDRSRKIKMSEYQGYCFRILPRLSNCAQRGFQAPGYNC